MTSRPRTLVVAAVPLTLAVLGALRSRRRAVTPSSRSADAQLSQAASGQAANRPTGISAERSESATAGHRATTDMLEIPANQIPASEIPMTAVHGVGPKIAAALVAAGINDLVALARATEEQLAAALENANIRRAANMASWSAQARAFVEAKA